MKQTLTPSRLRRAMQNAQALCEQKGVPLTRHRLAAALGVSLEQLQGWAGDAANPCAAQLRGALQEGDAQLLEYCLRTDVRHEQLAVQYLKSAVQVGGDEVPQFIGEDKL